ncbi:MAG: cell division protein MraZ [uncultured bacterium]|nr:MAG: cell division protein MraZ [uncultured bacterium]
MLIGHYFVKLTAKGRLAIPARFRPEIGNKAVVARFYEKCLVLVGLPRWTELMTKLTTKGELITQPTRDVERFILGSAFEIDLDSQGRFVVPQVLRDYASISDEIVFLGLGDRVEIWNKRDWEKRETNIEDIAKASISDGKEA